MFLGHIYDDSLPNRIHEELESIQYETFDLILLGGDLCAETTRERATLEYLDRLFNLDKPSTLWALGNHDIRNGHLEWIMEYTHRPPFYVYEYDEVYFLILNTNTTSRECETLNRQFNYLSGLEADLGNSKHLIVLTHHAIWSNWLKNEGIDAKANTEHRWWQATCSMNNSAFEHSIYPILLEVKKHREIEIILIAGDYGQRQTSFQFRDENGIWFLGNGFDNFGSTSPDSMEILSFTHIPETGKLIWNFEVLPKFLSKYSK